MNSVERHYGLMSLKERILAALERARSSEPPAIGIHLLMGEDAPNKLRNNRRNLDEQRIKLLQAALNKV